MKWRYRKKNTSGNSKWFSVTKNIFAELEYITTSGAHTDEVAQVHNLSHLHKLDLRAISHLIPNAKFRVWETKVCGHHDSPGTASVHSVAYNIYSTYQPSMFPSLIYRPSDLPIVLLIFYSGKVVSGSESCSLVFECHMQSPCKSCTDHITGTPIKELTRTES